MNPSLEFALSFSRLTSLLANRPEAVDEQKEALREAAALAAHDALLLSVQELSFTVASRGSAEMAGSVGELIARLSAHSVREIELDAGVPAADLLGIARAVADAPSMNDEGLAFDGKVVALKSEHLRVKLGRGGFVRTRTPRSVPSFVAGPALTPDSVRALPARGMTPPKGSGVHRLTPPHSGVAPARATPSHTPPIPARKSTGPSIRDEQSGMIELAISNVHRLPASETGLFQQLRAGVPPKEATRLLDEIATFAEASALRDRHEALGRVLHELVRDEADTQDAELRRAIGLAIRRLSKPSLLKAVARLLPRHPDLKEDLTAIFVRVGAEAADVLIELVTAAESPTDRRAYLGALVKCRSAVPTLTHLLGDSRWFVVRNAADLLGEMQAVEAEGRLLETVSHAEERVRRSVATALGRLGTARALKGVAHLLADPVSQVRVHAATALAVSRGAYSATVLIRALEEEQDAEVQTTILAALGRTATADAVERLIAAAESDGGFFSISKTFRKKKTAAYRMAAINALAEADTQAAREAVLALASDRDRDIRQLATRLVAGRSLARSG